MPQIRKNYRASHTLGAEVDPGLVLEMIRKTNAILAVETSTRTASGAESEPGRVYVIGETDIRTIARLSAMFGSLRAVNYLGEESAGSVVKPSLIRETYSSIRSLWDAQFYGSARRGYLAADPLLRRSIAVALWTISVRGRFRRAWSRVRSLVVRK